jgi:uncharacterized membrane protein YccC
MMSNPSLQEIIKQVDRLSLTEQLELIAYIAQKARQIPSFSAEAKAIERIKDTEESSQWVTTINPDDDINEQELKHWLHQRGYQTEISS